MFNCVHSRQLVDLMDIREVIAATKQTQEGVFTRYPAMGPRLFSCIKYVYLPFVNSAHGTVDVDGLEEGASGIDIVSPGWKRGNYILSHRTQAYWFTFNHGDKDRVTALHASKKLTTPEAWVKAGYAVVSTDLPLRNVVC